MSDLVTSSAPVVYGAVRSVGILKPFADRMNVVGTAFWLREARALVTCAHVVNDLLVGPSAGLLFIGQHDGRVDRASIDLVSFRHDLALLRLVEAPQDYIEEQALTGLVPAAAHPAVGTPVAYAGFPYGDQLLSASKAPTYSEGVVAATLRLAGGTKQVQITGPVAGGFSGSPVTLRTAPDQVVGVLANGPSSSDSANIFMAISWEHLRALGVLSNS